MKQPPSTDRLRIAFVEPYAARSHMAFAEGLARWSRHDVEIFSLPARAWKWRMRTSAIHFARVLGEEPAFDLYVASDYLNLAELLSLLPAPQRDRPFVAYFHENQLTYPLQPGEKRDHHFAMTHLYSMLVARHTLFNSSFHRREFLRALEELLAHAPDVDVAGALERVRRTSSVLSLATDVAQVAPRTSPVPRILWNHRWEYDKDPGALVSALTELGSEEDYRLLLLGERFREIPAELATLERLLGERIEATGFVADQDTYRAWLARADVTLSTARHEFFGLGTLEALRSGCLPVVPDDLAYPELLPDDGELRRRYTYDRAQGPVAHLRRALAAVRSGSQLSERRRLVEHTERFTWERVAPRFDAMFEELVRG